jgi:hypothetical protein
MSYCATHQSNCFTSVNENLYLYNLLVRHSSKEDILFILVRVKANNVRDFPIAESLDTLARFGIPQLHLTIVRAGNKRSTVIGKCDILYSFYVSVERPKTVSVIIDVPKLVQVSGHTTSGNRDIKLTLILVSIEPLRSRWPDSGNVRMTETPWV